MARTVCLPWLGLATAAVLPGGGHGFLSLQPVPHTLPSSGVSSCSAPAWGLRRGSAAGAAAAQLRRPGRRSAQAAKCKHEPEDDDAGDAFLDRRQLVSGLWVVAGGAAGFGLSRLARDKPRQQDRVLREVFARDRETLSEIARLREELLRRQREASEAGKDAAGAAHVAADGSAGDFFATGNIFSVVLTSAILWLQFGFFRREWQTIDQKYRSLGATDSSAGRLRPAPDFSWGEIVQYRLDLFYAKEPFAKGYIILNGAFIVVLLGAILLSVVQSENLGTALWESWTFVADPGTQVQVGGDKPSLRPLALTLTLAGLVTFALLVGLITESVSEQVDNFKKGISKVLDRDHVLMLGWTAKSLAIIEQLAFANKSQGGATIVVLANEAKEDMENELRSATLDAQQNPLRLFNSKVIFRGGDPLLENELVKVGITRCRTAIALSRDDLESEEADGLMLRQVCVYVCVLLMFC
jgi:hypothetical protein